MLYICIFIYHNVRLVMACILSFLKMMYNLIDSRLSVDSTFTVTVTQCLANVCNVGPAFNQHLGYWAVSAVRVGTDK